MTLLYILSGLTIFLVLLIIRSYIIDNEELRVGSIIGLVALALIGWLMVGTIADARSVVRPAEVLEVIKGKHVSLVIVKDWCQKKECDENIKFIRKPDELVILTDSTKFDWVIGYNLYGSETEHKLVFHSK